MCTTQRLTQIEAQEKALADEKICLLHADGKQYGNVGTALQQVDGHYGGGQVDLKFSG